jgi:hypothetical protein
VEDHHFVVKSYSQIPQEKSLKWPKQFSEIQALLSFSLQSFELRSVSSEKFGIIR